MNVAKFMVPKDQLVTLRPRDTVLRATEKMAEEGVSSTVIMKDDEVRGIVTTHDIVKVIASRKTAALSKPVEDIMSTNIISIKSTKGKNDAIKLMQEKGIKHLIVSDGKDNYVGIISSIDLVEEISMDIKAHPWIRN